MKILFVSLGCDKNRVDTEVMLGMLHSRGYDFTDDESEAEAAVVNTCCFINDAKQESIDAILELAELRKAGQLKALIVTGCLAQRYKEEIQDEIPEVDEILGVTSSDKIIEAIDETLARNTIFSHKNYFDDIFLLRKDVALEDIVLQPGENIDAKWADDAEIQRMIETGEFVYSVGVRYGMFKELV